MIRINTLDEVAGIRESAQIVGKCLRMLEGEIRPGVTTLKLDQIAEKFIREVVHGIPSAKRVLREGDVISLDIGVRREGWYGDAARTFPVGKVSAEAVRLLETTERALAKGIAQAREGGRISDISAAIEREAKASGFTVVRALVGHGIGRELHEDPQVPNYGRPGEGARLEEGMALAIEPMVNAGGADVVTLADQWTVVTVDRKISAHFEHTVAIGPNGPEVLSLVEAD